MRCVPERAACPASVAAPSRVSISRATLLRRASSWLAIVDSRSVSFPVMAASCGSRPGCGSRSTAEDISESCSSSLATRAGAPLSPLSVCSLLLTAFSVSSSWPCFLAMPSMLALSCSSLPSFVSAAARRLATSVGTDRWLRLVSSAAIRCSSAADSSGRSAVSKPSCWARMSAASNAIMPPAIPAATCVKKPPYPRGVGRVGAADAGGGVPAGFDALAAAAASLDEAPDADDDELDNPAAPVVAEAAAGLTAALSLADASATPALSLAAGGGVTSVAFRSRVACGRLPV